MNAAVTDQLMRPRGCTALQLRQLSRKVSRLYDAELAGTGLKTTQYSLLSYVARLGPIRPRDLAHEMQMDASTLTRNLRPLTEAGLLHVGPGGDARSRQISITPDGLACRAEAQRRWRIAQTRLNDTLGLARVAELHALIQTSLELLSHIDEGMADHD